MDFYLVSQTDIFYAFHAHVLCFPVLLLVIKYVSFETFDLFLSPINIYSG